MLAFPNVIYFFTHEFSGLRAGRFSLPRVFAGAIDCVLFRHNTSIKKRWQAEAPAPRSHCNCGSLVKRSAPVSR